MGKKLIEVALPLEEINAASAREKSIRHGHPSTLHLWWARRPLAATRAVIWSSLVDDPSSHPEQFHTEADQAKERERLFAILKQLVKWENSNNSILLAEAKAEIRKSVGNELPELLDPFAGGGAIPLEAQRLGLKAHAHDLNPVAVMINKAMIEIPPRFACIPPVNPEAQMGLDIHTWQRAQGLAEDVRYYGEWMKREAHKRIGHLYPKVHLPIEHGGGEATVIAWIWARTVRCPNPACKCEMPLASSFVLSKKKGHEAWVEPIPAGDHVRFEVHEGACPDEYKSFKIGRGAAFICPCCGIITQDEYVKAEAKANRLGSQLMAIVADGRPGRIYCSPDETHEHAAHVERPTDIPKGSMPDNPRWFSPPGFGMTEYADLFTNRQLTMLTTFSGLVAEAQKHAEEDALKAGMTDDGVPLRDGGNGAKAYGEAVGVYLAFVINKLSDYHSMICSWNITGQKIGHTFSRQAIPMVWDFVEGNPFCNSTGCFDNMLQWVVKCIIEFPAMVLSEASEADAQNDCGLRKLMISTDPPYYDNIGYADLSDFFYIWMRRALNDTYPELFRTLLVPKEKELIATPYRHDGDAKEAKQFFETGMLEVCKQLYEYTREDIPVTIYYAYKQSDSDDDGTASTGWETMLTAIIHAGFAITGTWPLRTEMSSRSIAIKTNALASSIVLVCRKRPTDAPKAAWRRFLTALRRELTQSLAEMQAANIAPVDLAQSAIGPGMAVFSRYSQVLKADGKPLSVRDALLLINEEIDRHFNEQDIELDAESRFCVELYKQCAFGNIDFGKAQVLATAKNTSIPSMVAHHILYSKASVVHLVRREEIPEKPENDGACTWLLTQQLARAMTVINGGNDKCADLVAAVPRVHAEAARTLAYQLYDICERKNWTNEAYAYNALVTSWQDILKLAKDKQKYAGVQIDIDTILNSAMLYSNTEDMDEDS